LLITKERGAGLGVPVKVTLADVVVEIRVLLLIEQVGELGQK
jgi:hypothetical protein